MKSNDHPHGAVPALGRTRRRRAALLAAAVASASLMGSDPSITVEAFHPPHGRNQHHLYHHHQHLHSSPASLFLGGTNIVRISQRYRSGSRTMVTTSSLSMTVTTAELIEYAIARKSPSGTEGTTMGSAATTTTIIRLDRPDETKPTRNNSSSSSSSSSSNVTRRRRQRSPRNSPVLDGDDVVQPTDVLNDDDEDQAMGSSSQGIIPLGDGIEPTYKSRKNNNNKNNKVDHPPHDELEALGITIPFGLRQQLLTNARQAIHKRIWIVDNSGSMNIMDGHRISTGHSDDQHQHDYYQYHDCTRWSEVQETVQCHAQLSAALGVPTDFHLLNPPSVHGGNGNGNGNGGPLGLLRGRQTFRVGYGTNRGSHHIAKDWKRAQNVLLRTEPNGKTPLADKIAEIRREIVALRPQLEAEHSKVCLVLATDGSNSNAQNAVVGNGGRQRNDGDGDSNGGLLENVHHISEEDRQKDIITALRSLQGLPVVVIIRLCTDHQPLVDFYSTCLDMAQNGEDDHLCQDLLEVDIDVLDDHWAEAREVHRHNPWLNYALILHRMREMGQDHRLFDLLDERPLVRSEVRDFVSRTLFGTMSDHRWNVHDDTEWARFAVEVGRWQERENQQWNPLTRSLAPWIDTKALLDVPP